LDDEVPVATAGSKARHRPLAGVPAVIALIPDHRHVPELVEQIWDEALALSDAP
jgi:hypothetical protein